MAGTDLLAGVSDTTDFTTTSTLFQNVAEYISRATEADGDVPEDYTAVLSGEADAIGIYVDDYFTSTDTITVVATDGSGNILGQGSVSSNLWGTGWHDVDLDASFNIKVGDTVQLWFAVETGYISLLGSTTSGSFASCNDTSGTYASPPDPINTIVGSYPPVAFAMRLMGTAKGAVYVNDAATLDAGAVEQTYPGTANWSDTSISMQDPIVTTGLTGQLYVIVETASGATASRAITISSGNSVTGTFSNKRANPQASLSGLSWAWFDENIGALTAPTATGGVATSDTDGTFSIDVTGTSLTTGQTGTLVVYDSTGEKYGAYRAIIGANGTIRLDSPVSGSSYYLDDPAGVIGQILTPPMGPWR